MERDVRIRTDNDITFISTHTLTWSVTVIPDVVDEPVVYFNSHAHVERDDVLKLERSSFSFQLTRSRGA